MYTFDKLHHYSLYYTNKYRYTLPKIIINKLIVDAIIYVTYTK